MNDDPSEIVGGPYHEWGDEDFDWKALDAAGYYLERRVMQFARMGIWTKEKYGTLRVSTTCAWFREFDFIHHWFHPGCIQYTWPRWFRVYVDWPVGKVMDKLGVIWLLQWYQHKVLKYFWKRAAKKWPQVAEEILDEYDWIVGEDK